MSTKVLMTGPRAPFQLEYASYHGAPNLTATLKCITSMRYFILATLLGLLLFTSCTQDPFGNKPQSIGDLRRLTMITDTTAWKGELGEALRDLYGAPYPVLPQYEPTFDVRYFSPAQFMGNANRRHLRQLLFVADLSDRNSKTAAIVRRDIGKEAVEEARELQEGGIKVRPDFWARNQVVIYIYGWGQEDLLQKVAQSYAKVSEEFFKTDEAQLRSQAYMAGSNNYLNDLIQTELGMRMNVPGDYKLILEEPNLVWIRREIPAVVNSNLLIRRIPYTDQAQLTPEYLLDLRDSLGMAYVTSDKEQSGMLVDRKNIPVQTRTGMLGNSYTLQARGLWFMKNDFMGGPFVSYLIHDKADNSLVLIDGFVFAPGQDKRPFMQVLENIIQSARV